MVPVLIPVLLSTLAVIAAGSCDLEVIVIGAGVSGLGAAQELLNQGCSVTVLEARDRTGGRIYTKDQGDNVVDMGASWIHGIGPSAGELDRFDGKMNPIYVIAEEFDIETVSTWEDEEDAEESFYWYQSPDTDFDGDRVDDLIDEIETYLEEERDSADVSDSVDDVLEDFDYGSTAEDELVYQFSLNHMFSQDYAAQTSDLSAEYFDDNYQFEGAEHIFPGGYKQIIDVLAEDVNILFNQVVETIDYSGDVVTVETTDGETYTADKVIVTVPLGVLQAGSITFVPELAEEKTDAIDRLGMGVMDKLWLEFEEAFWEDDEDADWICYISDTPGYWVETLNVNKYLGVPLLVLFNIGDAAKANSNLSDAALLADAMATIRKWYPDAPDHVRYSRSNWSKDPYAKGSYPFVKAGATSDDCETYREFDSTDEKVFFAGDGTICEMIGTVHGAYISGVDAANYAILGHDYNDDEFEDRYDGDDDASQYLCLVMISFVLLTL
jgi:monoamine oxidase